MKWIGYNALGAATWVVGLLVAKGSVIPQMPSLSVVGLDDHHLLIGACFGVIGLAILLWSNLRASSDLA